MEDTYRWRQSPGSPPMTYAHSASLSSGSSTSSHGGILRFKNLKQKLVDYKEGYTGTRARRITARDSRESSKLNLQANSSQRPKNRQIRLLERARSFSPFNGF